MARSVTLGHAIELRVYGFGRESPSEEGAFRLWLRVLHLLAREADSEVRAIVPTMPEHSADERPHLEPPTCRSVAGKRTLSAIVML